MKKIFAIILIFILIFTGCDFSTFKTTNPNVKATGIPAKAYHNFFDKMSFATKAINCNDIWELELYNSDDNSFAYINDIEVASVLFTQTKKVNINKNLNYGSNSIEFKTFNNCKDCGGFSPYTWGYKIYKNGVEYFKDEGRGDSIKDGNTLAHSASTSINVSVNCTYYTDCDDPRIQKVDPKSLIDTNFRIASFKNKSFGIKVFNETDIIEQVNYTVDLIEQVKILKEKIVSFNPDKDILQINELNTQLISLIQERDLVSIDLLDGLKNYKTSIRTKVNNALQETYSIDSTDQYTALDEYESKISTLDFNYSDFIKAKNTVSLSKSLSIMADQVKIMIDLIESTTNETLNYNVSHISKFENITPKEDKTGEIIKYLAKTISHEQDIFNNEIKKININFDKNVEEIENFDSEVDKIISEIKKIEEELGYESSFITQSFRIKAVQTDISNGFKITITYNSALLKVATAKENIKLIIEKLKKDPNKTEGEKTQIIGKLGINGTILANIQIKAVDSKHAIDKDTREEDCNKLNDLSEFDDSKVKVAYTTYEYPEDISPIDLNLLYSSISQEHNTRMASLFATKPIFSISSFNTKSISRTVQYKVGQGTSRCLAGILTITNGHKFPVTGLYKVKPQLKDRNGNIVAEYESYAIRTVTPAGSSVEHNIGKRTPLSTDCVYKWAGRYHSNGGFSPGDANYSINKITGGHNPMAGPNFVPNGEYVLDFKIDRLSTTGQLIGTSLENYSDVNNYYQVFSVTNDFLVYATTFRQNKREYAISDEAKYHIGEGHVPDFLSLKQFAHLYAFIRGNPVKDNVSLINLLVRAHTKQKGERKGISFDKSLSFENILNDVKDVANMNSLKDFKVDPVDINNQIVIRAQNQRSKTQNYIIEATLNYQETGKLNIRSGYPYENDNLSISKKMSLSDVRTYLSSKYKLYSTKRVVAQEVNKAFIESLTFINGGSKGQLNDFLTDFLTKNWFNTLNSTTIIDNRGKDRRYNLLTDVTGILALLPNITDAIRNRTITITEIENKLNIVANGIIN
ncbi:MAG: hypothetical protein U0457_19790 [Candidatus Sericytochromatia bacterium]